MTLKQIAESAGVSLTSVHRVLNGKGGCSKEVEENILRIAKEQGYTTNLAASALRRQPRYIALIFPRNVRGGRYFVDRILEGYLKRKSLSDYYNLIFQEFYINNGLDGGSEEEVLADSVDDELVKILQNIYRERPVRFDGIVIYGLSVTQRQASLLNRIVGSGTRVVTLERAPKGLEDICSVEVDDELAGNLAGEMLANCIHKPGTVAVITQQFLTGKIAGGDPNGYACQRSLLENRSDLSVRLICLGLFADQTETLVRELQKIPDLTGVYCTCARHTKSMLHALEILETRPQAVIGSELFDESCRALKDHRLNAILDKRPEKIGYQALQLLIRDLLHDEPLPTVCKVTPRLILRANCDIYYDAEKENSYGKSSYTE